MTKWLLKTGKGLLPREMFFAPTPPGKRTRFRKGHPSFHKPPAPKPPPHPLVNHPYRDAHARFLKGHPYAWQPNTPRPKAHQRKTAPERMKDGRFVSTRTDLPPRVWKLENGRFVSPKGAPQS